MMEFDQAEEEEQEDEVVEKPAAEQDQSAKPSASSIEQEEANLCQKLQKVRQVAQHQKRKLQAHHHGKILQPVLRFTQLKPA